MPPTRRTTTKPAETKAAEPESFHPEPGVNEIAIRVSDVLTKVYPDYSMRWRQFVEESGSSALASIYTFMRNAEMTFARDRSLVQLEGWVTLDDTPHAYYVRATRRRENRRAAKVETLGAAPLSRGALAVTEHLEPVEIEGTPSSG